MLGSLFLDSTAAQDCMIMHLNGFFTSFKTLNIKE